MNKFNVEPNELYYAIKNFQNNGYCALNNEGSEYTGRTITINGKKLLNFANCCYMGLEKHPSLIDGTIQAVKQFGTQNSMSRSLISSPLYLELESTLTKIFPGHTIIYPSTTAAHYSAMPLLMKEKDAIILDAHAHNSMRTASQLCKANGTFVIVSKHNDMEHVKYLVKRLKKDGYKNIWYCADGVYSMQGNVCDVKGLHKLLDEEENFYAYVDDAHGIGWSGKHGSGYVIGNFGLHEKMIVIGSLSKSIGTMGGIIIAPDKIIADYLKLIGHTFIFSIPIPPAILGSILASFKLHLTEEGAGYQRELMDLIHHFRAKGKELSIPIVTKDVTPIQLVKIGSSAGTMLIQKKLMDRGFFPTTAIFPAVSEREGGLRISVTRHFDKNDIEKLLVTIKEVLETENINIQDNKLVSL